MAFRYPDREKVTQAPGRARRKSASSTHLPKIYVLSLKMRLVQSAIESLVTTRVHIINTVTCVGKLLWYDELDE